MRVFLIDDEPNSPYIENVFHLFKSSGHNVECIHDVKNARDRIDEILGADIVIADLMMPETDESIDIPNDNCAVGVGLCEVISNKQFSGLLVVLTNATRERHQSQMARLDVVLANTNRKLGPISKLETGTIDLFDEIFESVA